MSILCYHSVDPAWQSPLAVRPEVFDEHCRWLSAHRHVVPLDRAVELLDSGGRLPGRLSALTFDDGFAALYENALPVLLRHRLPATVFLVAETLTPEGRAVDWVDTPPPWPLETLGLDQVLAMQDAGVSFASHSYSHFDLTTLTYEACVDDLRRSRTLLEDLLRRPVPFVAYPRGRHDQQVRRAAQRAGYTHSFALPESREPFGSHAVPRVGVFPGNGTGALRLKTARGYLALRHSPVFPLVRRAVRRIPLR